MAFSHLTSLWTALYLGTFVLSVAPRDGKPAGGHIQMLAFWEVVLGSFQSKQAERALKQKEEPTSLALHSLTYGPWLRRGCAETSLWLGNVSPVLCSGEENLFRAYLMSLYLVTGMVRLLEYLLFWTGECVQMLPLVSGTPIFRFFYPLYRIAQPPSVLPARDHLLLADKTFKDICNTAWYSVSFFSQV